MNFHELNIPSKQHQKQNRTEHFYSPPTKKTKTKKHTQKNKTHSHAPFITIQPPRIITALTSNSRD